MIKLGMSIIFCIAALVIFTLSAGASRRDLPVGLVQIYGDTSGIRSLTLEGRVASFEGMYGYEFHISPLGSHTEMQVFRSWRDYSDFAQPWWSSPTFSWHPSFFEMIFLPVGKYEIVNVTAAQLAQEWNVILSDEFAEYRIYGEVFAVETRMHGHIVTTDIQRSLRDTEHAPQLFIDAGEGGYIVSHAPDSHFRGLVHHSDGWMHTFTQFGRLPLVISLVIDDWHIYVPTGAGLFGETAVYGVHLHEGRILPVAYRSSDNENVILAEELIPITLNRGEDEIHGLLQTNDGFLLFISRYNSLEITHFNMQTRESVALTQTGIFRILEFNIDGDSIILHGMETLNHDRDTVVWTIDLTDDGLIMSDPAAFRLGGHRSADVDAHITLLDSAKRDGILYFVYAVEENRWAHPQARTRTQISAFTTTGQLIGRAQVLNGVEDDRFWIHGAFGSMSQPNARRVYSITIGGR
ncbi:MAG: hypothetical protein FWB87_04115 [Defluviitaleaceae bacterium]|nr:hypothetical protein [Defluviitaleaceae bacterium]